MSREWVNQENKNQFFALQGWQLFRIMEQADRLYSEMRMNGDNMRDMAHVLTSVIDQAEILPEETLNPQKEGMK